MKRCQLSSYGLISTNNNDSRAINNNHKPSLSSFVGLIRTTPTTRPTNLRAAKAGRALLARPKGEGVSTSSTNNGNPGSRPENIFIPDDSTSSSSSPTRVAKPSISIIAPSANNINTPTNTNTSNGINYFNNDFATNNTSNFDPASSPNNNNNNYSSNFNNLLRRVSTDLQDFDDDNDEEDESSLNQLEVFEELSMSTSLCSSLSSSSLVSELGCSQSSLASNDDDNNNTNNNGGHGGNVVSLISERKNEEFKLLAEEFKMLATVQPWKSPTTTSPTTVVSTTRSMYYPPKRNTIYSSSSDYFKCDYRRTVEEEEQGVTPKKSMLKRKHSLSTWREE